MLSNIIFNEVYDSYFSNVYSYFAICFDADIAQDLTQQTFLNVWKFISGVSYRHPRDWRAWIFRTAINVKNDFLRKKKARPAMVALAENHTTFFYEPEEEYAERLVVVAALESLKEEEREILLMSSNGLNSSELGKVFDISASAARSRLAKARKKFSVLLNNGKEY